MSAFACTTLCLVLTVPALQDDDDKDVARRNEKIAEVVKQEMNDVCLGAMRIEIKRMAEVMELDAKAVKRLTLAAKGAVKKTVDKYGERAVRFVTENVESADVSLNGKRIRFEEPHDADENEDEKPAPTAKAAYNVFVQVKEANFDLDVRRENGSTGSGSGGGLQYVRRQEVWKKALDAVATKEQRKLYDDHVAERRRKLAVGLITRAMALDLRMTDKQTEEFGEWANKQIKTTTPSDFSSGSAWVIRRLTGRLDTKGLDRILDADQLRFLQIRISEWTW